MKAYGHSRRDKLSCKYGCCTGKCDPRKHGRKQVDRARRKRARRSVLTLALVLLTGCAIQEGPVTVNVVCNRTIVGRDGLHYTEQDLQHIHCDGKHEQVRFSYAVN